MTVILDGKKLRDKIFEDLKVKVANMSVKPSLAVILAGDDPSSKIYVNNKKNARKNWG